AAVRDAHEVFADRRVVGGGEADPAFRREQQFAPRVGLGECRESLCVGVNQAADVAGGNAELACQADHQVCEILADAAAGFQHVGDRAGGVGDAGAVGEIVVQ